MGKYDELVGLDEDWLEEVISDSLDVDWLPRDAARLIMSRLGEVCGTMEPNEPGSFKGDIWFGDQVKRTLGTHQWDGAKWTALPSELESALSLLSSARERIATLEAELASANATIEALRPQVKVADAQWDAKCDELAAMKARGDRLAQALDSVMIGGNHLALLIGADHPAYTASFDEALAHYGPGDEYEVWCCWRNIMLARQALTEWRDQ